MTPDIQELKRLAEKAEETKDWNDAWLAKCALNDMYEVATPDTILALIEENERLREALITAEARVGELEAKIVWVVETLQEINVSNYDHDDVCRLNDASVEVILGLCAEPAAHNSKGAPDGR